MDRPQNGASSPRPGLSQASSRQGASTPPPLHDMNRVISLFAGRDGEKKYYTQGYLWKRVELNSDGKPPSSPQDAHLARWDVFFCQLTGQELSLWNAREMDAAAARGESIGPAFLRIADSFVSAVDPKSIVPAGQPPPSAPYVFSLNNAGANRILFAPMEDTEQRITALDALRHWLNCIRLAEWETARLGEIYTGTLLGLKPEISAKPGPTLTKGRLEEPVQIRLPGSGTEWIKAWMVVSDNNIVANARHSRRLSFQMLSKSQSQQTEQQSQGPVNASVSFFSSKRSKKPFFTFGTVTYAAAVYPDNPKMIALAHTLKMEGVVEWDVSGNAELPPDVDLPGKRLTARMAAGKGEDHATVLIMPDSEQQRDKQAVMLTIIMAVCEAYRLWGRTTPDKKVSFNPRDPNSPYFAFPIGPNRDRLFFDVPTVLAIEPWVNKPTVIKRTFQDLMVKKMSNGLNSSQAAKESQTSQASSPQSSPALRSASPQFSNGQQSQTRANQQTASPDLQQSQRPSNSADRQNRVSSRGTPVLQSVSETAPVVERVEPASAPPANTNRYLQDPNQSTFLRPSSAQYSSEGPTSATPNPSTASSVQSSPGIYYTSLPADSARNLADHHPRVSIPETLQQPERNDTVMPSPSSKYSSQPASALTPIVGTQPWQERPRLHELKTDENTLGLSRGGSNQGEPAAAPETLAAAQTLGPAFVQSPADMHAPHTIAGGVEGIPDSASRPMPATKAEDALTKPGQRPVEQQQQPQAGKQLPAPIDRHLAAERKSEDAQRSDSTELQHSSDAIAAFNYLSIPPSPQEQTVVPPTQSVAAQSIVSPVQPTLNTVAVASPSDEDKTPTRTAAQANPIIDAQPNVQTDTTKTAALKATPSAPSSSRTPSPSRAEEIVAPPAPTVPVHSLPSSTQTIPIAEDVGSQTLSSFEKAQKVTQERQQANLDNRNAILNSRHQPGKKTSGPRPLRARSAADNWSSDEDAEKEESEDDQPVPRSIAAAKHQPQPPIHISNPDPPSVEGMHLNGASYSGTDSGTELPPPKRRPSRNLPIPPSGQANGLGVSTNSLNSVVRGVSPTRSVSSASQTPSLVSDRPQTGHQQPRPMSFMGPPYSQPMGFDPRFMGMSMYGGGMMPSMPSFYGSPDPSFGSSFGAGGMLQTGLDNQQLRSAKMQEAQSRERGEPLIDMSQSPPPPMNGLAGTIAERKKEKRLNEQQRREAAAMRQSMSSPPNQFYPHMMPQMMSGMPMGNADAMAQQQHFAMQAAAQQAAQQAYMMTMQQMYSQQAMMAASMGSPMMGMPASFSPMAGTPTSPSSPFMHSSPSMAFAPFQSQQFHHNGQSESS